MAESKKVQSSDIISDDLFVEQIKNAKLFEAEIDKLVIGLKEINKESTKTLKANKDPKNSKQIKEATKALEDKKKVDEAIVKLEEKKIKVQEKSKLLTNEQIKQNAVNKAIAKDRKAELEALAIIESKILGTEQKLLAQQTLLRLERKKLNEADKDYAVKLAEINKKLDENNAKISANSDKLKRNSMNVGNYTESMRDAINSSNLFSKVTGNLSESNQELVSGLGDSVKGLKNVADELKNTEGFSKKAGVAMKALGIAIIIQSIRSLKAAFESTGKGADTLKEQLSGIGGVGSVIFNRLAIEGEGFAKAMEGLFTLDWNKFNEGTKISENAWQGVTKQFGQAYESGVKLQKILNEFEKTLRLTRIQQQEFNLDEEDFNEIASDTTRGIDEQREALIKSIEKRRESAKLGVEIAKVELKQQRDRLIFNVENQKQTKETAEALILLRKNDLREAFKNNAVLKLLQADELNLLEEKVKAEKDAVDKLSDLPRQDAQRKREQIQRETAFQIDLIQKKKLNAGSEIAVLTKKIADEKIQLLDREIFIANLAKAEKRSTDEQVRIFNEGLRQENEINKNNEAKQKKIVDFNDLIATKDEVLLGEKLRGLKLTESQTEQTAKIVKDAQNNQIANDELIIKLQNDKIASLEKQFKIEQDIISLQKQSEIDIIKEQEAEKQRQLDLANQKIIEGENVNQKIMIDFRKQSYDETIKYLDLEYEARENQLKRNSVLAKIENDKIIEQSERVLANQKVDEQYRIDTDKLEREILTKKTELAEKESDIQDAISKRRKQIEIENTVAIIEELQKVTSAVSEELDNRNNINNQAKDKEIEKTKTSIDRQRELAEKGAENTLAFEEAQLAKRELKQQEALEKQARQKELIQLTEAYFNALNARLTEVGGNPDTAPVRALGDVLIAKGVAKGIVQFAKDGNEMVTPLGVGGQDGVDDIPFMLTKGEAVIPKKANIENHDAVKSLINGNFEQLYKPVYENKDTATNIYNSLLIQQNDKIISKLDDLIAKPVQQIDVDSMGNIRESILKQVSKTVIIHKQKTRI